jgi:hypothetical protein
MFDLLTENFMQHTNPKLREGRKKDTEKCRGGKTVFSLFAGNTCIVIYDNFPLLLLKLKVHKKV